MLESLKYKRLLSLFVCLILFSGIFVFLFPTYHSSDDNILAYQMGGGFGDPPTNLLHYNFTWHPWLGLILAKLFSRFPDINWYSFCLIFFHFISWLLIANTIFKRCSLPFSVLVVTVLFVVFEAQFLLRPTYTNTSIVLTIAAIAFIVDKGLSDDKFRKLNSFIFLFFIGCAALLRVHVIIPFALLLLVSMLLMHRFKMKAVFSLLLAGIFLVLLLQHFHKEKYLKIPGWQEEEEYRQAVLRFDNHFKKPDTSLMEGDLLLKYLWLDNGILIDKQFLDTASIHRVTEFKTGKRKFSELKDESYWLFQNNRLGIITATLFLFFALVGSVTTVTRKAVLLMLAGAMIAACWYLLVYMKLPYYLPLSLLYFLSLISIIFYVHHRQTSGKKVVKVLFAIGLAGCTAWGVIRLVKVSNENKEGQEKFMQAWEQINRNQDKLYIAPYYSIPFDDIFIFTSPNRYPIKNVVYKNQLMNDAHRSIYNRFGITSTKDLFINPNVRFITPRPDLISRYFSTVHGGAVQVSVPGEQYTRLPVSIITAEKK